MMETSGSAATEDRIAALEKKVREMEALVKGLTQELLDLKSVAMKMSKQSEERSRQELEAGPVCCHWCTSRLRLQTPAQSVFQRKHRCNPRKGARQPEAPAAPPEPAMDMIMQPDGTMKLEPRRGDKDYIVASCRVRRRRRVQQQRPNRAT